MNEQEILTKVAPIIADKLGIHVDQVTLDAHFVNDLGADSLGLVDITMALEEEYNLEIPDEESSKLVTVGAMIQYIAKNVK